MENMMCLDVYLDSLNEEEYRKIKPKLNSDVPVSKLPMSWDIISVSYANQLNKVLVEFEAQQLEEKAKTFDWSVDLDNILSNPYQALVLTDSKQSILWVNKRFEKMTGYPQSFAVGKKPSFLQGPNTSLETNKRIRNYLKTGNSFEEMVINYKKDAREYLCQVAIFPITNNEDVVTHFLALENEIK